ncbi:Origin recognition complex, subunit 1 [Homalodisca vitripennis]|nr:Origin recognition complex, subunit 1 [Homalodisca vitripennis]
MDKTEKRHKSKSQYTKNLSCPDNRDKLDIESRRRRIVSDIFSTREDKSKNKVSSDKSHHGFGKDCTQVSCYNTKSNEECKNTNVIGISGKQQKENNKILKGNCEYNSNKRLDISSTNRNTCERNLSSESSESDVEESSNVYQTTNLRRKKGLNLKVKNNHNTRLDIDSANRNTCERNLSSESSESDVEESSNVGKVYQTTTLRRKQGINLKVKNNYNTRLDIDSANRNTCERNLSSESSESNVEENSNVQKVYQTTTLRRKRALNLKVKNKVKKKHLLTSSSESDIESNKYKKSSNSRFFTSKTVSVTEERIIKQQTTRDCVTSYTYFVKTQKRNISETTTTKELCEKYIVPNVTRRNSHHITNGDCTTNVCSSKRNCVNSSFSPTEQYSKQLHSFTDDENNLCENKMLCSGVSKSVLSDSESKISEEYSRTLSECSGSDRERSLSPPSHTITVGDWTTECMVQECRPGRKRKAQSDDSGVKPSKISCDSPAAREKNVLTPKVKNAKAKLLTPRSKQKGSSHEIASINVTPRKETTVKSLAKAEGSSPKVSSPGTRRSNRSSSTVKKNQEDINLVKNDVWRIKSIDSPKKLSAKKNLFSPEKQPGNLGNLRVRLSRLPRTYIESSENESSPEKQMKSPIKFYPLNNANTPEKSSEEKGLDSPVKGGNRTPLKNKELQCLLDDSKIGVKDIKLLNERSPSKQIPDSTDYSSPASQKTIKSLSKLSHLESPNVTPSKRLSLRTRTPQKGSDELLLKEFSINLSTLHELSPSSKPHVNSPNVRRGKMTSTSKASTNNVGNTFGGTSRKEQPVREETKEDKKENEGISSDEEYCTPSKMENKILSQDKRTPLSSSKYNEILKQKCLTPLRKKDITVTTPVSKKKSGRGFLTPSMARKERVTDETHEDALDMTRKQLHISTIPKSLPCRDSEFGQVKSFLLRKIEHSAGGCMYISGVPGTGKTATVHAVVRSLQQEVSEGDVPEFDFVEVNGLRLTEPRQAYVRIYQALTDQKVTPDQAQQLLNKRFSGKCKKSTIILVDELDYLCNRRQDVVYNILDWPTKRSSALVVLTISNTMDLPERTLKGRVTSRMGLTRLVFQPYSHHQLREIVQDRLCDSTTFHPDAVQLVARKVAAVSGDARRALDICRRTTELVGAGEQVTVAHVERALTQIFSGPRVVTIQSLSGLGRLVLRSLRDVNQRTGVDEASIAQLYHHLQQVCVLEAAILPPVGTVLQACVTLVGLGLVMAEKGRMDLCRKVTLNVSSDDIHYALDNLES